MTTLQDIEVRFTAWALAEEAVRAAVVVGSQTRTDHPADPWSDLDIILFANGIEKYLDNTAWFESFAPVWLNIQSRTVAGEPEHLVLYAEGLQVDFVLNEVTVLSGFSQLVATGQLPETVHRGVRVLLDKDHLISSLPNPGVPPARLPPTQAEFTLAWERFWFTAVHAAKQLRRGDLVFYKGAEQDLRHLILPFLEWHTRLNRGWGTDTWHQGRFISEWLDSELYAWLASTYTPLEPADCWQSLQKILDLAQRIIQETSTSLGISIPLETSAAMRSFIAGLADGQ